MKTFRVTVLVLSFRVERFVLKAIFSIRVLEASPSFRNLPELCAIADYCLAHGASEVLTAVLVDKEHDRKARPGLKADFTGLYVEDRFLFGYGMDYKGYWRNAPGIYAVKGL